MRTSTFAALVFTTSVALWAADKAQLLNVKLGLWEVTTTVTRSGSMPIPAEVAARLTPEQRARVEERMKARSAERRVATTRKHCLTREEVEKGTTFDQDQKSCSRTVLLSTTAKVDVRIACEIQGQGIKSAGELQIEALDPEKVKGLVRMTIVGDRTAASGSTFTARWIGPICGPSKKDLGTQNTVCTR